MLNFRIQKHCDDLLLLLLKYELSASELTRRKPGRSWLAINFQRPFTRLLKQDGVGQCHAIFSKLAAHRRRLQAERKQRKLLYYYYCVPWMVLARNLDEHFSFFGYWNLLMLMEAVIEWGFLSTKYGSFFKDFFNPLQRSCVPGETLIVF